VHRFWTVSFSVFPAAAGRTATLLAQGRPSTVAVVASGRPLLITPHPGEMSRLSAADASEIASDRVGTARAAAEALGCAVLLKGAPSVVAAPGAPVLVDLQGSSDLAVAAGLGADGLARRRPPGFTFWTTGAGAAAPGRSKQQNSV